MLVTTPQMKVSNILREKCSYPEISGPYFLVFGQNKERYSVSLRVHPECGKIRTRKVPNTDTLRSDKLDEIKDLQIKCMEKQLELVNKWKLRDVAIYQHLDWIFHINKVTKEC